MAPPQVRRRSPRPCAPGAGGGSSTSRVGSRWTACRARVGTPRPGPGCTASRARWPASSAAFARAAAGRAASPARGPRGALRPVLEGRVKEVRHAARRAPRSAGRSARAAARAARRAQPTRVRSAPGMRARPQVLPSMIRGRPPALAPTQSPRAGTPSVPARPHPHGKITPSPTEKTGSESSIVVSDTLAPKNSCGRPTLKPSDVPNSLAVSVSWMLRSPSLTSPVVRM